MVRASPPVAHPSDMTCVTVIVTCRVNISNILKAGHVHNRYTIIHINWWKIDFLWFKYLNMCTYSFLLLTKVFFFLARHECNSRSAAVGVRNDLLTGYRSQNGPIPYLYGWVRPTGFRYEHLRQASVADMCGILCCWRADIVSLGTE